MVGSDVYNCVGRLHHTALNTKYQDFFAIHSAGYTKSAFLAKMEEKIVCYTM